MNDKERIALLEAVLKEFTEDSGTGTGTVWAPHTYQAGVFWDDPAEKMTCVYCCAESEQGVRVVHTDDCPIIVGRKLLAQAEAVRA